MAPTPSGGPDSIQMHDRADERQSANLGTGLHDVNADPEPGKGQGQQTKSFEYHGWRKLIRNFTPS